MKTLDEMFQHMISEKYNIDFSNLNESKPVSVFDALKSLDNIENNDTKVKKPINLCESNISKFNRVKINNYNDKTGESLTEAVGGVEWNVCQSEDEPDVYWLRVDNVESDEPGSPFTLYYSLENLPSRPAEWNDFQFEFNYAVDCTDADNWLKDSDFGLNILDVPEDVKQQFVNLYNYSLSESLTEAAKNISAEDFEKYWGIEK